MDALTEVVRSGKARYIGFSEWPVDKIEAALALPGVEPFVSSQPQYSLIWRGPERDVIPFCREHGISQIVWSPLAQGVLTGKYKPGEEIPADSRAASEKMNVFMDKARDDVLLERVQRLGAVAGELGITLAPARARLGAARAERRLRDHRRLPAGAGRRERGRRGRPPGRGDAEPDRRDPRRPRALRACDELSSSGGTTLPGFMIPFGSRSCLMPR